MRSDDAVQVELSQFRAVRLAFDYP